MKCPKCGVEMIYKKENPIFKYFAVSGCIGCLFTLIAAILLLPLLLFLIPLAFFLPIKEFYLCPKCGFRERLYYKK